MNCTGTAKRLATAELGAHHAEHIPQNPQQRDIAVDIDVVSSAVHFDRECHHCLSDDSNSSGALGRTARMLDDQKIHPLKADEASN